ALGTAVDAAARATEADPNQRAVFARYDINPGFFEHEGADEIAKLWLPGNGPDGRELAYAAVRSLGMRPEPGRDGPLVAAFRALLANLIEELGGHQPFLARLADVAATRTVRAGAVDELELAAWLVD